ncbi:pimeloyl-ACP methyl ester carboxylesterase [Paraburkholderia sp. CI3]
MASAPLLEAAWPDAADAVVFVNRNPGSTADWTRLAVRVREFGRALAMDMPGFGNADKPEQFDYRVRCYARHLGRLLVECNVQRARLVMHDFGGPWGSRGPLPILAPSRALH